MHKLLLGIITLFFIPGILIQCKDDKKPDYQSTIIGYWKIRKGFRDDRETESLSGTYFQFMENHTMITNLIPGADVPQNFECTKNKIVQQATPPITYTIEQANDSILNLTVVIRGIDFKFELEKGAPEPVDQDVFEDEIDSSEMDTPQSPVEK